MSEVTTPLLFLPALFLDRRMWQRTVAQLPRQFSPVYADRPSLVGVRDPLAALRACEQSALAQLQLASRASREVVLVGASLGGHLAGRILAKAGGVTCRYVAISSLARVPPEMSNTFDATAERLESGELELSALLASLRQGAATEAEMRGEPASLLAAMLADTTQAEALLYLRMTAALADPVLAVPRFDARATLIHARDDAMVPFSCCDELALLGARVERVNIESSSHVLPMTHPVEVARAIVGGNG